MNFLVQLFEKELNEIYAYVKNGVCVTPLVYSESLSKLNYGKVYLKLENLQLTHSFKARGAFYKLSTLKDPQKERGILAASAGNHGKAVAYFAQKFGIPSTIVMPVSTPQIKIDACLSYGAEIHLYGNHLAESFLFGNDFAEKNNLTLIHPYDDEDIIRGQSTVGVELMRQVEDIPDKIIVPVGGGGLASGICLAFNTLSPKTQIIGVQSAYAPEMANILGYQTNLAKPKKTIAEGIGVKAPGILTREILKNGLSHMYVMEEQKIAESIVYAALFEKIIVEGAGAAGLAAFLNNLHDFTEQRVVIMICGGNIDPLVLSKLLR